MIFARKDGTSFVFGCGLEHGLVVVLPHACTIPQRLLVQQQQGGLQVAKLEHLVVWSVLRAISSAWVGGVFVGSPLTRARSGMPGIGAGVFGPRNGRGGLRCGDALWC